MSRAPSWRSCGNGWPTCGRAAPVTAAPPWTLPRPASRGRIRARPPAVPAASGQGSRDAGGGADRGAVGGPPGAGRPGGAGRRAAPAPPGDAGRGRCPAAGHGPHGAGRDADASTPTQDLVLARKHRGPPGYRVRPWCRVAAGPDPGAGPAAGDRQGHVRVRRREGKAGDRRPPGSAPYGRLRPTRPGEYLLLDTTPLDVFAMEPVTLRWVRCELTIAMDLYSRCITGLRLSPASTKSVDAAAVLSEVGPAAARARGQGRCPPRSKRAARPGNRRRVHAAGQDGRRYAVGRGGGRAVRPREGLPVGAPDERLRPAGHLGLAGTGRG